MIQIMSGFRVRQQRMLWFGLWRECVFWIIAALYQVGRTIDDCCRLPEQKPRSREEHRQWIAERLHRKALSQGMRRNNP